MSTHAGAGGAGAGAGAPHTSVVRTYEQECAFIKQETPTRFRVDKGFVPNMRVRRNPCRDAGPGSYTQCSCVFWQVPGVFYVNKFLKSLMFEELQQFVTRGGFGGFLPGMKQLANVAALPGIVGVRSCSHACCCVCSCCIRTVVSELWGAFISVVRVGCGVVA